jgi:hypothetical protein
MRELTEAARTRLVVETELALRAYEIDTARYEAEVRVTLGETVVDGQAIEHDTGEVVWRVRGRPQLRFVFYLESFDADSGTLYQYELVVE